MAILSQLPRNLALALIVVVPALVVPIFHREFASSKILGVLLTAVPMWAVAELARKRSSDGLDAWRARFVFGAGGLLAIALLRHSEAGAEVSQAFFLLACPLLFMRAGACLGTEPGRLLSAHAVALAVVASAGFARRHLGIPAFIPDRPEVGLAATIGNSNELAEWAAPLVPLLLIMGLHTRRPFWLAGAALGALLTFASDSRAGVLALGAGLLTLLTRPALWRALPSGHRLRNALVALLLLGAVCIAVVPNLRARAASVFDPEHATNVVRLEVWSATLELARSAPLSGVGLGRFDLEFERVRTAKEWRLSGVDTRVDTPHQEALMAWAEGGILGVGLLLLAALSALTIIRRAGRGADQSRSVLAGGALAVFVATGVLAAVRSPFHHPAGWLPLATVLGALLVPSPGRSPSHLLRAATNLLLLFAVATAVLGLARDREIFRLRRALVGVQHHAQGGNLEQARADLLRGAESVLVLSGSRDHPPWLLSARSAYRALLDAHEIATLRVAFLANGQPNLALALPGDREVALLSDHILRISPNHASALRRAARAALTAALGMPEPSRSRLAAELLSTYAPRWRECAGLPRLAPILADAAILLNREEEAREYLTRESEHALEADERARVEEGLGRVALARGRLAPDFGLYLDLAPALGAEISALRAGAEAKLAAGDRLAASRDFLRVLHFAPADPDSLQALATIGFALREDPLALRAADAAVARVKLLLACGEVRHGNLDLAAQNVRLSIQKDPDLLDARWVQAELAALAQNATSTKDALQRLRTAGVPVSALEARAEESSAAAAFLALGGVSRLAP